MQRKHRWQCHGVDTNEYAVTHTLETTKNDEDDEDDEDDEYDEDDDYGTGPEGSECLAMRVTVIDRCRGPLGFGQNREEKSHRGSNE